MLVVKSGGPEAVAEWRAHFFEAAPALGSGRLSGAVLDVFDPEPLPNRCDPA